MSKILDNMEVEGYQESTTVIVCGDAFGSANDAAAACLKSHGSDPEGETFQFKAVSLDQASDTRWLTVRGDYTLVGAISKFENCRAVDSSSGALATLPFDFGGSLGAETIRIYGCVSHEDFDAVDTVVDDVATKSADVRTLQDSLVYMTNPVAGITTSSFTNAADNVTVTPISATSTLRVRMVFNANVGRTTNGTNYRFEVSGSYNNSSSTIVSVLVHQVGEASTTADSNQQMWADAVIMLTLAADEKNGDGDWEIVPQIRAIDSDTNLDFVSGEIEYRELL